MSRPTDWSPLTDADPVPGDPVKVASIGGQLTNVAAQIRSDVTWLQSLCTAQFWDSGAGQAFQGQVDDAAAKLTRAHERYLAAGQALGTSPAAAIGYASALDQAQALSLRALSQAQGAWAVMRTQLAAAEIANKGFAPYQGPSLYASLNPAQPLLDSSGNPVLMFPPADATTPLRTAVARYNASALDYRTANGWLAQAIAGRDAAAASAAAAIRAALGSDGLQDQTGLWHDITSAADATFGWAEQHWAQVVGDIATVCGWIATALGVLALIFAFICPPLALALEGMALTLTEAAAVCHLILATFGKGSWMDVGLDLVALATFGWGRNMLRAGEATVAIADEISMEGMAARADTLFAGLSGGDIEISDIASVTSAADRADDVAIAEFGEGARVPGIIGKFAQKGLQDFKPLSPVSAFKTARDTDWESVLGKQPVQTITNAVKQAAHLRSPEIAESLKELNEIPGIAKVSRLTGINFPNRITYYGRVWTGTQVGSLTTDTVGKVDSALNYFHIDVPGYDWLKEKTTAGILGP
ncbi:MAG TPA: hypothetical protein VHT26_18975 [Trebonia sp.]|nr:hypothetical protein [Trebonia sp.]